MSAGILWNCCVCVCVCGCVRGVVKCVAYSTGCTPKLSLVVEGGVELIQDELDGELSVERSELDGKQAPV